MHHSSGFRGWPESFSSRSASVQAANGEYEVPIRRAADAYSTEYALSVEYEVPPSGWPDESQATTNVDSSAYVSTPLSQSRSYTVAKRCEPDPQPRPASQSTTTKPGVVDKPTIKKQSIDEDVVLADIQSILSHSNSRGAPSKQPVSPERPRTSPNPLVDAIPGVSSSKSDQTSAQSKNEHEIFDRLAQSMKYANAYDLGKIALEQRFDQFDEEADKAERPHPLASTRANPPMSNPTSTRAGVGKTQIPIHAKQQDFVEDLDAILGSKNKAATTEMPMDPSVDGPSIAASALQPDDSTTWDI
ncbi:MAG: hypothetical protein R3C53_00670 [Pirellulaceae bacterium]